MWGQREDGLLAVEQQTGETPQALVNKPRLHAWLTWLYEAFWMLDAGRPIHSGSVGRIPLTEMAAYLEIFELHGTDAKQSFITTMRALDSVYIGKVNAEITRKVDQSRKEDEERRLNGR